jgi:DNA-binding response OmpR family regulator
MAKVLVVEDDSHITGAIRDLLSFENHQIDIEADGLDGYERLQACIYDLIILDWDLPGISGLELCQKFRFAGGVAPILMLTGKSSAEDKEAALDSGADDYVCKPFNAKELRARVRALLRRPPTLVEDVVRCEGIVLDPRAYSASVDDVQVKITAKEFMLLHFFIRHPNQVFSIEALTNRLWPNADECSEEAVRMAIKRLRQKLGQKGALIQTLYGSGYVFSTKGQHQG